MRWGKRAGGRGRGCCVLGKEGRGDDGRGLLCADTRVCSCGMAALWLGCTHSPPDTTHSTCTSVYSCCCMWLLGL